MALAATGAECVSASPSAPVKLDAEAKLITTAEPLPTAVTAKAPSLSGDLFNRANLTVAVKPYLESRVETSEPISLGNIHFGSINASDTQSTLGLRSAPLDSSYDRTNRDRPHLSRGNDNDGAVMASIADAKERQLLFVKITRG